MNEDPLDIAGSKANNPDENFFTCRFSSPEEAILASQEILIRYGWDSDIVRRHSFTPVNVSFEM
jgi:hypothetical protein